MYNWDHERRINDYTGFIKKAFGERVQKIAIDAGFTCPNRDGTKSIGGCLYCDNSTFNTAYCSPTKSITQQLEEGVNFFSAKYQAQKYLAYFQSYSNTYADVNTLRKYYLEALNYPKVIGLVIATRPDCIDNLILDLLEEINKKCYLIVEFGIESTINKTLQLVNRCVSWEETKDAIIKTHDRGIKVGGHLIIGLPSENEEIILLHVSKISELPLTTLKFHQLQVIKNSALEKLYHENPELFINFTLEDYADLMIQFLERLNPEIVVERFLSESPIHKVIAPKWGGIKNFEFVHILEKRMNYLNTWQGKLFNL